MSVTLQEGPQLDHLATLIAEHQARLCEFDALDQIEIQFAAAIVAARMRKDPSPHLERGFGLLRTLPQGVGALLRRLCVVPAVNDGTCKTVLIEHRLRSA